MPVQNVMTSQNLTGGVLVDQYLSSGEATQYEGPDDKTTVVATARLTNKTTSAVTVSVSVVSDGNAAGDSNRIMVDYSLAAKDDIEVTGLIDSIIGAGDLISASASAATSVAFVVTGWVFSS